MAVPSQDLAVRVADTAPGASDVFPPFDAHTFVPQLVWLVVIFGALYYLMSRIALPRVGSILEARHARIAGDLADAKAMQRQAADASAAYDAKLAQAKAGAQAMAQDTQAKLLAETDARRHALEASLNGKLAAAEAEIRDTRARAMASVDGIAREAAAAIVTQLTGKPPASDAVDAAVASLDRDRPA